jgi:CheY-like chemotaxis protein
VWRQKEAVLRSSNLTRLLLANSAHEVRTPLNAIINYLEIALEGTLDEETRENLARSHSASKSLIYVINDLLDLTKTEEGQNLITDDVFNLSTCIRDATEPFLVDAKRKGIEYHIVEHPGLPQLVHGDERRIRQAISNVTANAVTHTSTGYVKIEVFVTDVGERQATIEFVVEDTGAGMSVRQLDTLFRDLEQVSTEESPLPAPKAEKQAEARALGLGLAVVARIVRNMNGQLRLKSEAGLGSRFVIQIPFLVPEEQPATATDNEATSSQATPSSNTIVSAPESLKAAPEGEIMLVNRTSMTNLIAEADAHAEQASFNSHMSGGSYGSRRSDAERLIDAIQTPLSLDDNEPEYHVLEPTTALSNSTTSAPRSNRARSYSPRRLPTQGVGRTVQSQNESGQGPGFEDVRGSKTPIRAVRIPDEYTDLPRQNKTTKSSQSGGEFSKEPSRFQQKARTKSITSGTTQATDQVQLQVLVAEDDPINMKILRKRLERTGHGVHHSANGEDCATVYRERSPTFDVVLMDMQVRILLNKTVELWLTNLDQMPIVDGLTSTKMIRAMEKSPEHAGHSRLASSNYRIPIFAVSASLIEKNMQTYVDAGFDGWILKPIDFKRLSTILAGISDEDVRISCLYEPGEWERGGWFSHKYDAGLASSEETPRVYETSNKQLNLIKETDTDTV